MPAKLNLESFNSKNSLKIKNNWPMIKDALNKMLDVLDKIGFSYQSGLSENALIPIVYYIMKGGNVKSMKALDNLKLYYVVSQVNGIFGGQGEQVLEKVRAEFQRQRKLSDTFNFYELSYYQRAHSYLLLSLLYKNLDLKARINELDHIHPRSKFKNTILISKGITDEAIREDWIETKKDKLANLQLLDPKDNNNKKSKTIIEYLENKGRGPERIDFLKENLLPAWSEKWLLDLKNFDKFIKWREEQLFKRLKSIFKIKK
jgi:5-methylcytosine-specific restriction endonuclease McrA